MDFLISPASLAKTVALTCVKMIYSLAFTLTSSPEEVKQHEGGCNYPLHPAESPLCGEGPLIHCREIIQRVSKGVFSSEAERRTCVGCCHGFQQGEATTTSAVPGW